MKDKELNKDIARLLYFLRIKKIPVHIFFGIGSKKKPFTMSKNVYNSLFRIRL